MPYVYVFGMNVGANMSSFAIALNSLSIIVSPTRKRPKSCHTYLPLSISVLEHPNQLAIPTRQPQQLHNAETQSKTIGYPSRNDLERLKDFVADPVVDMVANDGATQVRLIFLFPDALFHESDLDHP